MVDAKTIQNEPAVERKSKDTFFIENGEWFGVSDDNVASKNPISKVKAYKIIFDACLNHLSSNHQVLSKEIWVATWIDYAGNLSETYYADSNSFKVHGSDPASFEVTIKTLDPNGKLLYDNRNYYFIKRSSTLWQVKVDDFQYRDVNEGSVDYQILQNCLKEISFK